MMTLEEKIDFILKRKKEEHLAIVYGMEYYFPIHTFGKSKKWHLQIADDNDSIGKADFSANGFIVHGETFGEVIDKAVEKLKEQ